MHADTLDIDLAIREFEQVVKPLFDEARREFTLAQTELVLARKNHKARREIERRIVLMKALELAGA